VTFVLDGPAIFYEKFEIDKPFQFDPEIDQIVGGFARNAGSMPGYCNIAGIQTRFHVGSERFREGLVTPGGSSSRLRAVVCAVSLNLFERPHFPLPIIIEHLVSHRMATYIADTTTPIAEVLRELLPPDLICLSEYLGEDLAAGTIVSGTRHEDLQKTSFASETFDMVVACEVLEHVPDAEMAEREVVRILKPGGVYFFTVPLDAYAADDEILAALGEDGTICHFSEPVYHHDPLRPEGALAFRIFSVSGLKRRFEAMGCSLTTYRFWSKTHGIMGADNFVHVVVKDSFRN
jgi:SAM-dependent methyltransferase